MNISLHVRLTGSQTWGPADEDGPNLPLSVFRSYCQTTLTDLPEVMGYEEVFEYVTQRLKSRFPDTSEAWLYQVKKVPGLAWLQDPNSRNKMIQDAAKGKLTPPGRNRCYPRSAVCGVLSSRCYLTTQ